MRESPVACSGVEERMYENASAAFTGAFGEVFIDEDSFLNYEHSMRANKNTTAARGFLSRDQS